MRRYTFYIILDIFCAVSENVFYSEQGHGRLYANTKVCQRNISETVYVKAVTCFLFDISLSESYIQTIGALEPAHPCSVSTILTLYSE